MGYLHEKIRTASLLAMLALSFLLWETIAQASEVPRKAALISLSDRAEKLVPSLLKQAKSELNLALETHHTTDKHLVSLMERISEDATSLVIFLSPKDTGEISALPGLYPDIKFTVVDSPVPLYFSNLQASVFNDQEGAFLAGIMAALKSRNGSIGFYSADSSPRMRNLAYGFFQGAKHASANIDVIRYIGEREKQEHATAATQNLEQLFASKADVILIADPDAMTTAARYARQHNKLIILFQDGAEPPEASDSATLTTLRKRTDLACLKALKDYQRGAWHPGVQYLGVKDGYVDYTFDQANRDLISRSVIDRVETSKDLILRGTVTVTPYSGNE